MGRGARLWAYVLVLQNALHRAHIGAAGRAGPTAHPSGHPRGRGPPECAILSVTVLIIPHLTWAELCEGLTERPVLPREKITAALLAADTVPREQRRRIAAEAHINTLIIDTLGAWSAGWCWSTGSGGLVRAWCCPQHSVLRGHEPPDATSDRVLDAVEEWRDVIASLAEEFAALAPVEHADVARTVEHAAGSLTAWVVARSEASDAWYQTLATVLVWYLQAWSLDAAGSRAEIRRVLSGHFASWTEPDDDTTRAAGVELGVAVQRQLERPRPDATLAWIDARRTAFNAGLERYLAPPEPVDGHRRFIEGVERRRDPERAERMLSALTMSRRTAKRAKSLNWPRLAAWNACLRGLRRSPYRKGKGVAKGGRERYSGDQDTFRAYLAEANHNHTPWYVRAARVYLDICFFHPFEDGNARTARLALDYVMTRSGYRLGVAEPVFVIARAADDTRGPWRLAWLILNLSVPIADEPTVDARP